MAGTIAWKQRQGGSPDSVLRGTRLKPGTIAEVCVDKGCPRFFVGVINGTVVICDQPTFRAAAAGVERTLLRKGWLAENAKWAPGDEALHG